MKIDVIAEARAELDALPPAEPSAMDRAIEKLGLFGDQLRFPHSSQVRAQYFGRCDREQVDHHGEHSTFGPETGSLSRPWDQKRNTILVAFAGR